ncbi:MAG: efflux RND transporter permease subunit, partial [bacterium]|nr:efflux RND transporter permease subunit [bacterium]
MAENQIKSKAVREFTATTISLKNKNTVYLVTFLLALFGIIGYKTMPMEMFPEVNIPKIYIKTIYPGNAPVDMENLITRPLEKEVHTIQGIKKLTSFSTQDNSDIVIEFNSDVDIDTALQDVKDAIDRTKSELPNDLDMDPLANEVDVNEFPIISINLSGDYSINELKDYAEYLQDEIESLSEISKVDIKGLNEREIQINIDQHKLESLELSFQDIEDAVNFENVSISGGDLIVDKTSRSVRTIGEFSSMKEIEDIVVKNENGNIVHLRDVATVKDDYEDPLTYARLDSLPVVSLQVIKKSGENLLVATDKMFALLEKAQRIGTIPKNMTINFFNDQSDDVRNMVNNLENSIIMGVIFVVLVLFFFLGFRNAVFVGIAIPMSMFISFSVLGMMGSTINIMVLFGLVLALGMLVDNAIVVVENIYRFIHQGHSMFEAAKQAVGEIAMPIIASTATTLAAFIPLVFWKGLVGEFMKHLPVTLIIVLTASLFVALIIIPVLASSFIKKQEEQTRPTKRKTFISTAIVLAAALLTYEAGINALGTFLVFIGLLMLCNFLFLHNAAHWFQTVFLTKMEDFYLKVLSKSLKGIRPVLILVGTFALMLLVFKFYEIRNPKKVFFPENEPKFINIMAELPIDSDISATNEFMFTLENKIFKVIKPYESIVDAVMTTVGKGVVGENEMSPTGNTPQKGMTTISFVKYEERGDINTSEVMKKLSSALLGKYAGVQVQVLKNSSGPPTGKPINLEITGLDVQKLITITQGIQAHFEKENIPGIEGLKMDLDVGKPELLLNINRENARRFGLSTAQIASTIRTA